MMYEIKRCDYCKEIEHDLYGCVNTKCIVGMTVQTVSEFVTIRFAS